MAASDKDLAAGLETLRDDIAALSDTVSRLVSDTAGMKATLKRELKGAARSAVNFGENVVHEAEHLAEEAAHAATRRGRAAVHNVEQSIEHNPLTAVLIALGAGILVGFLTRK